MASRFVFIKNIQLQVLCTFFTLLHGLYISVNHLLHAPLFDYRRILRAFVESEPQPIAELIQMNQISNCR